MHININIFPLQMGLLLTNAWRIESSSVRLYTSLRSWPFFSDAFFIKENRWGNG